MHKFRYLMLLICLSFGMASCGRLLNLTAPSFSIPYGSFQIQIFNVTSPTLQTVLYYAPAVTLLPDATEIMLNTENGANCLFVEVKLWDKPYLAAIQNFVRSTQDPQTAIFPLPFKFAQAEYSPNGFTRGIKNSSWQPIAGMPPAVSLCIRCPTPAACNDTKMAIQTDSASFASHLFVTFAIQEPFPSELCFDRKGPFSAITNSVMVQSAVRNYTVMRPDDFRNFVRVFVGDAIQHTLGRNAIVVADDVEKVINRTYFRFPHYSTTTAELDNAMWEALYWDESERPDRKARRLESVLGNGKAWLKKTLEESSAANNRNDSIRSRDSQNLTEALDEFKSASSGIYWNGDRILPKPFPVYVISLDLLNMNLPFCIGSIDFVNSSYQYTVTANLGKSVSDTATPSASNTGKRLSGTETPPVFANKSSTFDDAIGRSANETAIVHWQCRRADNLWAFSNSRITVTLRDANDQPFNQSSVTTTYKSGEFTLSLPRTTGYSILFETSGYSGSSYTPIILRNFSHLLSLDGEIFMEPLLFIPDQFKGTGKTGGIIRLISNIGNISVSGIKIQLRAGVNNYTGPIVANTTTTINSTWSVALPGGHYTATVKAPESLSAFTAPPFTVTIVPGRDSLRDWGMTPEFSKGGIRIILRANGLASSYMTQGLATYDVKLRITGRLRDSSDQGAEVGVNSTVSADKLMVYDYMDTVFGSVLIRKQLPGVYRIEVYEADAMKPNPASKWPEWNLANSQAMVQIYRGDTLWAQYFVPITNGTLWTVAEINGSRITVINQISTVK
ncbi:uncharacterized protein LOC129600561 [Paramacrobiotus metropolitanus]|uniref:uncharacterized protein LOC129600561 n=1 Tax=Paramacrobiotus metropolitanus TaxID=2943436 RepID=UPI002445D05C|nr:uncharacterized protein LOC129600561 [Paramacrobiotus metropolitanus]